MWLRLQHLIQVWTTSSDCLALGLVGQVRDNMTYGTGEDERCVAPPGGR